MHLVIVAGGLGSRLAPLTNNIPKFLVNIGKETGFVEQINYWKKYNPYSITVIVHSAYKDLVQAYYDLYFTGDEDLQVLADTSTFREPSDELKPTPFIVKTVDEANGSAHAIMTTCDHLVDQPVLFTWCDVLPGEYWNIEQVNFGGAYAFMNYDHPNRYDLVQVGTEHGWKIRVPKLREDGRGGIFGIYYVSTYRPVAYKNGQDFVEVLAQYGNGNVDSVPIGSIIDFGDKPKLERTRSTADAARSFNSVEMHGDLVLKTALNEQGASLIKREISWYDELQFLGANVSRPMHWTNQSPGAKPSFVMSRVKGVPIWQAWPHLDVEGRQLVLRRIFDQLDALHSHTALMGHDVVARDITIEARDKLLARYREIKRVIAGFGKVHTVNGQSLYTGDPEETINALFAELYKCYVGVDTYSLIHGDLQMSNSMIDPDTLEVTLIDPRGYFGKTNTYGLADYDIAKLYYSLSGYDLFNYSKDFHIEKLSGGEINFKIPKPDLTGCQDILIERFWFRHQLWLAVIWIGLAQYIKNDPVKSVCAHYYGLAMAERLLRGVHGLVTEP